MNKSVVKARLNQLYCLHFLKAKIHVWNKRKYTWNIRVVMENGASIIKAVSKPAVIIVSIGLEKKSEIPDTVRSVYINFSLTVPFSAVITINTMSFRVKTT